MARYVLPFNSPEVTLPRAGGKGLNLGELARAGFPVPPGFIITTEAYAAFCAANRLQDRILAAASQADAEDPASLERASAQIRSWFRQGEIPSEIVEEIEVAYRWLSQGATSGVSQPHEAGVFPAAEGLGVEGIGPWFPSLPVAVRSSATAEDLPGLSFAGQQDSFLNVVGTEQLQRAVRECWSSLWTARAIGYRARNGIPSEGVSLAVVVQLMIAAETSGVLFTANPLTGRRDEIVIDASYGLGEAIVSGQVEPDHYVVDSRGARVLDRRLGSKAIAIHPMSGGGTQKVTRDEADKLALADSQILRLAEMGSRVAEQYGSPQDIEWAWEGDRLYVLQSRPITSLYPLPSSLPSPDGLHVYASINSVQGITAPFTPLGRDALRLLLGGVLRALGVHRSAYQVFPEAGGRLYVDVTDPLRDPRLRVPLFEILSRADPVAKGLLRRLLGQGLLPQLQSGSAGSPLPPRRAISLVWRARRLILRILQALLAPGRTVASANVEARRQVERVRRHARSAQTLSGRLTAMERDFGGVAPRIMSPMIPMIGPAFAVMAAVDSALSRWLGERPGAVLGLMRGLPGNVTTEMDMKLWATAQAIRSDGSAAELVASTPAETLAGMYLQGALPPTAQDGLYRFLQEYGMRAIAEIDLGLPRWREDPTPVLQVLQSFLLVENPSTAPDVVLSQGVAEAGRLGHMYVERARQLPRGALKAKLLEWGIRRARILGGQRESPKFYLVNVLDAYRTALLESGRELAARGELNQPQDIFFLPFTTLKQYEAGGGVDLKAAVASQRAEYQSELARRQLPRLLLSTGETYYEEVDDGTADLAGEPVSPGVVEGPVMVVLDPRGIQLKPGDILVCPATDPGWTPLFLAAGGLITEIGGMMTHGSVVAREYGIPAVVGVRGATTRLKTGQRVQVDGTRGRIRILDDVASLA